MICNQEITLKNFMNIKVEFNDLASSILNSTVNWSSYAMKLNKYLNIKPCLNLSICFRILTLFQEGFHCRFDWSNKQLKTYLKITYLDKKGQIIFISLI